jgi:small subunit ribosomal protein S9
MLERIILTLHRSRLSESKEQDVSEKKAEFSSTGRRKTSMARVNLVAGDGKWKVNRRDLAVYFTSEALRNYLLQPLTLTNTLGKYDIAAKLAGGGISGQAGALRHALARALILADASHREVLKASGCLTRDSRMKERKKSGQPGARKRFQFSKR